MAIWKILVHWVRQVFHTLMDFTNQYPKVIIVIIFTDYNRKCWEDVKLVLTNTGLSNFYFCLTAGILSLTINPVSCFIWSYRIILLIFENMFAKYSILKKWQVQLATQTIAQKLFLETTTKLKQKQKCFMHTSHFATQNIEKKVLEGWNLIKL